MWITIDQLECLRAVKETSSITAASEKLNRAKSAIHYSLKKLEEQVDFPLLQSKSYRSQLTKQAEQLLIAATPLMYHYELLKDQTHQIASGTEAKITVSLTAIYPLKVFNSYIVRLQKKFPATEIVFHTEILSGKQMLSQDIVDIAVFEHTGKDTSLEMKKIADVDMHLTIAKSHPLNDLPIKEQNFESLIAYPQVVQRATIQTQQNFGVLAQSKQWTVTDLTTKKQIILDGLGWGRLPYHDIESEVKNNKLTCLDHVTPPEKVSIFIGRKKSDVHGKVNNALWNLL